MRYALMELKELNWNRNGTERVKPFVTVPLMLWSFTETSDQRVELVRKNLTLFNLFDQYLNCIIKINIGFRGVCPAG